MNNNTNEWRQDWRCRDCDETGSNGSGEETWGWRHTLETGHTTESDPNS